MKIDDKDRQLIALLRNDARMSVVELARQLGVSRATIQNRMRRLERDGVIVQYTVTLKADTARSKVRALMSIATETKKEQDVIHALRGYPAVAALHHTTGRWDLIAELQTDSLADFNNIVGQVRLIDGVTNTESNLLLDSHAYAAK